jgi:hypothetical protein
MANVTATMVIRIIIVEDTPFWNDDK